MPDEKKPDITILSPEETVALFDGIRPITEVRKLEVYNPGPPPTVEDMEAWTQAVREKIAEWRKDPGHVKVRATQTLPPQEPWLYLGNKKGIERMEMWMEQARDELAERQRAGEPVTAEQIRAVYPVDPISADTLPGHTGVTNATGVGREIDPNTFTCGGCDETVPLDQMRPVRHARGFLLPLLCCGCRELYRQDEVAQKQQEAVQNRPKYAETPRCGYPVWGDRPDWPAARCCLPAGHGSLHTDGKGQSWGPWEAPTKRSEYLTAEEAAALEGMPDEGPLRFETVNAPRDKVWGEPLIMPILKAQAALQACEAANFPDRGPYLENIYNTEQPPVVLDKGTAEGKSEFLSGFTVGKSYPITTPEGAELFDHAVDALHRGDAYVSKHEVTFPEGSGVVVEEVPPEPTTWADIAHCLPPGDPRPQDPMWRLAVQEGLDQKAGRSREGQMDRAEVPHSLRPAYMGIDYGTGKDESAVQFYRVGQSDPVPATEEGLLAYLKPIDNLLLAESMKVDGPAMPVSYRDADGTPVLLDGECTARTAEVRVRPDEWYGRNFMALKRGDVFRLREADGSIVDEGTALEVCIALSDAYIREDGVSTIMCEEYDLATGYHATGAE